MSGDREEHVAPTDDAVPEVAAARGGLGQALRTVTLAAVASGLVFGALAWFAATALKTPAPTFGVVDLHRLQEYRQLQLATLMLRPGASDSDKARAKAMAESLGPEIENAIRATRERCACTILVKAAVVVADGSVPDYTAELMERLQMTGESADEMQARLKGYMNALASRPAGSDTQMQDLMLLLQKGAGSPPEGRR